MSSAQNGKYKNKHAQRNEVIKNNEIFLCAAKHKTIYNVEIMLVCVCVEWNASTREQGNFNNHCEMEKNKRGYANYFPLKIFIIFNDSTGNCIAHDGNFSIVCYAIIIMDAYICIRSKGIIGICLEIAFKCLYIVQY